MDLRRAWKKLEQSPSNCLLYFCGCFLLGIAVFSNLESRGRWPILLFLFLCIILFSFGWMWSSGRMRLFLIGSLFFIVGAGRLMLSLPDLGADDLSRLINKSGGMEVVVSNLPIHTDYGWKYVVSPEKYRGKMLVYMKEGQEYFVGDKLAVYCEELKLPANPEETFWKKYWLSQGVRAECGKPVIEYISSSPSLLGRIDKWRRVIAARINNLWPEPAAGLAAGILYGERTGMDKELKTNFSRAGLTHIVAVSGYNTSIVSAITVWLLVICGINRRRAFWPTILILFFFVLFTGASAAVARAGIMSAACLLGEYVGRPGRTYNALIFAATILLIFNPFLLVWDMGYQLSFLATIGVTFVGPTLFGKNKSEANEILAPTLGAILMTTPLIAWRIGTFSLVAPVANLLALWTIPFIMIATFVAVTISLVSVSLSIYLAWFGYLGLEYVIMVAEKLGGAAGAAVSTRVPGVAALVAYGVIAYLLYKYESKNKNFRFWYRV